MSSLKTIEVNLPGYEKLTVDLDEMGKIQKYNFESSSTTLDLFLWLIQSQGSFLTQWEWTEDHLNSSVINPAIQSSLRSSLHTDLNAKSGISELASSKNIAEDIAWEADSWGRRPISDRIRSSLLIKELILKARGEWEIPYANEVVCNCREVKAEAIDQVLAAGSLSVDAVSAWTTACTACTTCKSKIEDLIQFRKKSLSPQSSIPLPLKKPS